MTDDHDLAGLDPYDLMATEADRLDRYFAGLDDAAWTRASRCDGWTVRDMLAHLTASEDYNRACLDGTAERSSRRLGATGRRPTSRPRTRSASATSTASRPRTCSRPGARSVAENREAFRARDGGDVDSSVGAYPARLAGVPPRVRARDPRRRRRRTGGRLRGRRPARVARPVRPVRAEGDQARRRDRGPRRPHPGAGRRRRRSSSPTPSSSRAAAGRAAGDPALDAATRAVLGGHLVARRDAGSSSPARPARSALPVAIALAARPTTRSWRWRASATPRSARSSTRAGVTCVEADLAKGTLDGVPTDVDYVCNFAVVKSNRWDVDLAGNAEAAGLLMAHCRTARAFLHCSSTGRLRGGRRRRRSSRPIRSATTTA